jgi:high-affinity Fe2+/Pb2+ permease
MPQRSSRGDEQRSRVGGVRPRNLRSPRWIVRLALLIAVALGALVYLLELEPAGMLRFLLASFVFVVACALLALVAVAALKQLR